MKTTLIIMAIVAVILLIITVIACIYINPKED